MFVQGLGDGGRGLVDVREVARLLGCSVRTVYSLRQRGALPAPIKLGALTRWSASGLRAWISGGCPTVHEHELK